jgi:hypothetical protein
MYDNVPYAFIGSPTVISRKAVGDRLRDSGISEEEFATVIELLLWFGVLGVYINDDEERYSYQFEHDPKRMTAGLNNYAYCIHPSFRMALGCTQ